MCEKSIVVRHVRHGENIQLYRTVPSSRIDREQDWPGKNAANETDNDRHLEVAKEEEAIKRVVLEDIGVGQLCHGQAEDPVNRKGSNLPCSWV